MVTKKIMEFFGGGRRKASKVKATGKRQHPRLRAFNLIKFTLSDGTHYESISNVVDISESGLKFTCYEPLPVGANLKMIVAVPERNKEVGLEARVVWIRKTKNVRGVYLAGVSFLRVSEESKDLIRGMLQSSHPSRFR